MAIDEAKKTAKKELKEPLVKKTAQKELEEPLVDSAAEESSDEEDILLEMEGESTVHFRQAVGMACRTALMCLLTALPIIVPVWYNRLDKAYTAMITSGVIEMVIFTVYKNLGLTVQLAWQGFIGTLAACAVLHVLCALMPLGAAGDAYNPAVVHVINVAVFFIGLWLNISKNVRMFWLCWHAYFMMEFVNPNTTSIFNTTWSILPDAYTTTVQVTTTIGVSCAVLVTLLPFPVRAKDACHKAAMDSVGGLTTLMSELSEYFCRHEGSVRIAQLEARAQALRGHIDAMQQDLDGSWWETFDLGSSGTSRELLGRHLAMMRRMMDMVFALQVCISKEDFAETHIQCMEMIGPAVRELLSAVKDNLRSVTHAANDGSISAHEHEHLEGEVERVKEALAELATKFNAMRMEISPEKVITTGLQSESFFVQGISMYARLAYQYTEEMLNVPVKTDSLPKQLVCAFIDIFNPSVLRRATDVHSFTIRNTISLVLCFYIGYFCLGYSGVVAGTAAVLITDFTGSALHKNLMRLQAVCIGSIIPHIISRMVGTSCDPTMLVVQGLCLVAWELLTCYVYYSSANWGYVGCLTAAFATLVLVYPCVPHESTGAAGAADQAFRAASFEKMTETAMAAIVMTLVDMTLMSQRASSMATDKVLEALLALDAGFQAMFVRRKATGAVKKGTLTTRRTVTLTDKTFAYQVTRANASERTPGAILGLLGSASALSEEADKEPRYFRAPWPMAFFGSLVRDGYILEANLTCIEEVLQGSQENYADVFEAIRHLEPFASVQRDLTHTCEDCMTLVQAVLRNETGMEMPDLMEKMNSLEKVDKLDTMPDLIDAINASDLKYPEDAGPTMEDDMICRINVVLMLFESTVETLASMVKDSIRQVG